VRPALYRGTDIVDAGKFGDVMAGTGKKPINWRRVQGGPEWLLEWRRSSCLVMVPNIALSSRTSWNERGE
jgi:hypothetical protein